VGPSGIALASFRYAQRGRGLGRLIGPGLTLESDLPTGSPLTRFFPNEDVLTACTVFGFAVTFCFFADRTSLFLKEHKQFDSIVFGVLMLVALAAGLATMSKPETDLGFLNRDQTDEWKGWMQLAILIYRELDARPGLAGRGV
jgi:N-acetylneuraminate 9-O-acetyltransferase